MFLQKIEISGFKSFANKTVLDFSVSQDGSKGLTAIVGPNGSGKSNIADAIRWVMGEQSMKNLRGKKSEDIIFAGSGKKARLGSAHVTLYFDNSDKRIPLEFSEVSISRKIFRSGESEYIINNSKVRLQDVVDILAKAGIGKESYSIINQGMADAVLNATPLERRSIVEESAGVKPYQIKKERSLRKLETTRENLERARDLAKEIEPNLRILKRQAEKSQKGAVVLKDLKEKQEGLYSFLWNSFQKERNNLLENKDSFGVKMMNLQREVDKLSDEISGHYKDEMENKELAELNRRKTQIRGELNQLEKDLIITEGRIEIHKEKQENFRVMEEMKIKSIPVDLNYVKENLSKIEAEYEELLRKIDLISSLEDLGSIKESAQNLKMKLLELKQDLDKGEKETKPEEIPAVVVAEETVSKELEDLIEKSKKIRKKIEENELEQKNIEEKIRKEVELDRQKRHEFFEAERKVRLKQDELNKLKDQFNEAKISLAKVEVREEDLRSEISRELKITPEEIKPEAVEIDRFSLEREIAKLKFQSEQIGGIDPMVQEEYEETQKRYDFLLKESQDLEEAIISLREIIKEMDQKIEESFYLTFDEINKEFGEYFKIIFGGGSAHLAKVKINKKTRSKNVSPEDQEEGTEENETEKENTEENSEIGIDIFACPPGKRINSLSILSGGERSLTSLALLFAIISHNPPPFAILDEVEAALDEANSRRFGRIIQELSSNTQFVIITHNRETMRQASLLYGVTMGEDGISKLLSVKLDQIGQGGRILK